MRQRPSREQYWPDQGQQHGFLPNVWLGVSAENQQWADIRIPALIDTPAAVRWISAEPLLGPIDLSKWICDCGSATDVGAAHDYCTACTCPRYIIDHSDPDRYHPENVELDDDPDCPAHHRKLHWVVTGGESGPGARPMHPDWARSIRDQCTTAAVPFLFKQWGAYRVADPTLDDPALVQACPYHPDGPRESGADIGPWVDMRRVGKKAAGRVLDGQIWDQYPEVATT